MPRPRYWRMAGAVARRMVHIRRRGKNTLCVGIGSGLITTRRTSLLSALFVTWYAPYACSHLSPTINLLPNTRLAICIQLSSSCRTRQSDMKSFFVVTLVDHLRFYVPPSGDGGNRTRVAPYLSTQSLPCIPINSFSHFTISRLCRGKRGKMFFCPITSISFLF